LNVAKEMRPVLLADGLGKIDLSKLSKGRIPVAEVEDRFDFIDAIMPIQGGMPSPPECLEAFNSPIEPFAAQTMTPTTAAGYHLTSGIAESDLHAVARRHGALGLQMNLISL